MKKIFQAVFLLTLFLGIQYQSVVADAKVGSGNFCYKYTLYDANGVRTVCKTTAALCSQDLASTKNLILNQGKKFDLIENCPGGTGGSGPVYNPVNTIGNNAFDTTLSGSGHDKTFGDGATVPVSSGCPKIAKLSDLICEITWLLNRALYFIFALAFIVFLHGVYKYIKKGGDEKARKEGANFMWYGIVSLAVMFSVWGLVNFVLNSVGFTAGVVPGPVQNAIQGK